MDLNQYIPHTLLVIATASWLWIHVLEVAIFEAKWYWTALLMVVSVLAVWPICVMVVVVLLRND